MFHSSSHLPWSHLKLWFCFILLLGVPCLSSKRRHNERELRPLSTEQVSSLVSSPDPVKNIDPANPSSHLSKILIPRPPDTDNSTLVRNYIASILKALQWEVEEDSFVGETPYGSKRFTNVIATKDPSAPRRIILAAHFDSKFYPNYPQNQFVGATDSAAPCAMLLDLAEALNPLLERRKDNLENGSEEEEDDVTDVTLQLLFFDGEEAFKDWTATDSIYGARHLAEKWAGTYIAPHSKRRLLGPTTTEISSIDHLVLLDLLGAANPIVRSSYLDTAWLFDAMISAETRLAQSGAFVYDAETSGWKSFFIPRRETDANRNTIGDDHVPFLQKGVSILHIIATPFPTVWHTLRDDASALHVPTMRRWNLILRVFTAEYLGLRPEQGARVREGKREPDRRSHEELAQMCDVPHFAGSHCTI